MIPEGIGQDREDLMDLGLVRLDFSRWAFPTELAYLQLGVIPGKYLGGDRTVIFQRDKSVKKMTFQEPIRNLCRHKDCA